jgi:pyoverdine/dityrosine biosynthesis protein Dit1
MGWAIELDNLIEENHSKCSRLSIIKLCASTRKFSIGINMVFEATKYCLYFFEKEPWNLVSIGCDFLVGVIMFSIRIYQIFIR